MIQTLLFLFTVQQPVVLGISSPSLPPFVRTSTGDVRGFSRVVKLFKGENVRVDSFLGVPYAEPPIGPLRFRPAVPVRMWNGTRNATSLPNSCWQEFYSSFNEIYGDRESVPIPYTYNIGLYQNLVPVQRQNQNQYYDRNSNQYNANLFIKTISYIKIT